MTLSRSRVLSIIVVFTVLAMVVTTVVPETSQAKRERPRAHAEVVNGSDVADGQFPFVAAIGYGTDPLGGFLWDNQFCGGSLVAASLVLTAAHCVEQENGEELTAEQLAVVVGRTVMTSTEGQVRHVTEIIRDPDYDPSNVTNDLAVLRLNQPVVGITPITLVGVGDTSLDTPGAPLTITGWGDARPQPHGRKQPLWPDVLQQAQVNVVDDATCAKEWARAGYHNDPAFQLFLCTTPGTFGSGDSGGPLFTSTPSGYVQVSLVSGSYAKHHKNKNKKNKKKGKNYKKQKKLHKVIPDYGPELSNPSIAAFLDSVGL
jgi:secreted trypsin-like serine protease